VGRWFVTSQGYKLKVPQALGYDGYGPKKSACVTIAEVVSAVLVTHQQLVLQMKEKIKSDPRNYHFIKNGSVMSKPKR
jgi:hypothetical protein